MGVSLCLLAGSVGESVHTVNQYSCRYCVHLLLGSTCLLMRALTQSRRPREHSMERGVSPSLLTTTVGGMNEHVLLALLKMIKTYSLGCTVAPELDT